MESNERDGVVFDQPTTLSQRREIAENCSATLRLTMPCIVDDLQNSVDEAYAAWPERLFIVDKQGLIAYASGQGPFGFEPKHIKKWLRRNVGRPHKHTRTASGM